MEKSWKIFKKSFFILIRFFGRLRFFIVPWSIHTSIKVEPEEFKNDFYNYITELIDILEPSWKKKGKLILVNAEGNHTLKGVVGDGKIDKIIVNDEEEIILDDNSFKAQVFVPNDGIEVRIIGYKNNQIKKKLIFTIKVGN